MHHSNWSFRITTSVDAKHLGRAWVSGGMWHGWVQNYNSPNQNTQLWVKQSQEIFLRACWRIQCNHVRRVSTANFACWLVLVCCNLQSLSSEFSAACLSLTRCNLVFLSSEVSFPFFRVLLCCKLACLSLAIWVLRFRLKESQFAFMERRTYGRYII